MAKLATCPGCTTQLALPEDATLSDRARCPRCHEEFLLMETVQFSIPTAEILPPPATEVFSPTETISPATFSPIPDLYVAEEPSHEQSASSYEASPEAIQSYSPEPTPEPLPMSATLSDWEARLKRAIAADVDEPSTNQPTSKPSFEFAGLTPPKTESIESVTSEPQDFSVPDTDLVPDSQPEPVASRSDWSAEDSYQDEAEPTVKFTADQTIAEAALLDYPQVAADQVIPVAVQTDVTSARKRKRSPLRTLVSASLGVVGIPLGLYALLWLRGPEGDMLHIAQYLPSFMLPAEFSAFDGGSASEQIAQQPATSDVTDTEETLAVEETEPEVGPLADAEPLVRVDSAVAPASAELPTYQGPKFDLVDATEFGDLLTAAQQFAPQLSEGDLKSKESVASKGQAYMALARLADKSAFLHQSGHTPDDTTKVVIAEKLFQNMLSDNIARRDLPQIALRWWQYADRPSQGIVFVGEVKRLQTTDAGPIAFVSLGVDAVAPEIPVLIGRAAYQQGDLIGIAGSIEQNTEQRLPALGASLGPAVIAHYSFPLDGAASGL